MANMKVGLVCSDGSFVESIFFKIMRKFVDSKIDNVLVDYEEQKIFPHKKD